MERDMRAFWKAKRKNIGIFIGLWATLLLIKYGDPELYSESRKKTSIDLAIIFLIPLALLWDWIDFRKNKKGNDN